MSKGNSLVVSICAATTLLNLIAEKANANPLTQEMKLEYLTNVYKEGQVSSNDLAIGSATRYTINTHQLKGIIPLASDTELSISGLYESMTGASPWYVVPDESSKPIQVMSGATIVESRSQVDASLFTYSEKSESTFAMSFSTENDYDSLGFGYSGGWRFNEGLTTLSYGMSAGQDSIRPTQDIRFPGRVISEAKSRVNGFLGFSQIMTKNRLVGATVGLSSVVGYLSDPYKQVWVDGTVQSDSRPDRKSLISTNLLWREFIMKYNAAFHADIALYQDNWSTTASSIQMSWYQNIGFNLQVIPTLRFYHQTEAAFFDNYYSAPRGDEYYSSDYRLSEFSSLSARLKIKHQWSSFKLYGSYEYYNAVGEHPGLINYSLYSFGLGAVF